MMKIFRDCQMCVIGASIYDPMRVQLLQPEHIDSLFMLFEKKGFRLRIDYIDPAHQNNYHEIDFVQAYHNSIQEINIHTKSFKQYIEISPIETEYLIVIDFTGTYTPQEIERDHNIKQSTIFKDTEPIPYNLRTIFLPLGCSCVGFNYTHLLEPLIEQYEFKGLHIDEFSLLKSCREMITRVNEQKDICLEALVNIDGYQIDDLHHLKPYLEMLIAEWDIHFDPKILLDYLNRLTTYYTNHPEHIELFEIHRNYIVKNHTAIQTQIVLLVSILQGLFHYKEVKSWFNHSLPELVEKNNRLIPFYIYTTLEVLCRKKVLSNENTLETGLHLFKENNRKAWLQKHSVFFEPLFMD